MNISSLIKIGLVSQVVLVFLLSVNTSSAAKLYKWVDAQGRISYQDKPPPQNSKILSEKTLKSKKNNQVKVDRPVNTNPIDVYVTKSCPSCDGMLEVLENWGVPYTKKAVEDHREIQTRLLELTGGIRVPALFDGSTLIEDTSTTESLRASLKQTGHLKGRVSEDTDQVTTPAQ